MKIILYIQLVLFLSLPVIAKSLFDSNFYELSFYSEDVESDKLKKISEIKFETIDKIFRNILIENDYISIKNNFNEDFINVFIKNIIIDNEKIINNNYYSKIKVNYNKKKIIKYLRENSLSYVEFLPENK